SRCFSFLCSSTSRTTKHTRASAVPMPNRMVSIVSSSQRKIAGAGGPASYHELLVALHAVLVIVIQDNLLLVLFRLGRQHTGNAVIPHPVHRVGHLVGVLGTVVGVLLVRLDILDI